uniref:Venom peptide Htgkr8 n=1 Tax=Hadogenes troglodytes TaxID=1577150 RepID=A0A1B3IJ98_9SCOR|nr:venom peptide Htgkr8 [Hadogenes troglodytes]
MKVLPVLFLTLLVLISIPAETFCQDYNHDRDIVPPRGKRNDFVRSDVSLDDESHPSPGQK